MERQAHGAAVAVAKRRRLKCAGVFGRYFRFGYSDGLSSQPFYSRSRRLMKPELLAPAGTLKNMRYAFAYGADAVYAGQPRYSLRVRENDFNLERLAQGIGIAHELGRKFYVASNIAPHNSEVIINWAERGPVIAIGPAVLIMTGAGLIMMVRVLRQEMQIRLLEEANVLNYASVQYWERQAISRIVLSRG